MQNQFLNRAFRSKWPTEFPDVVIHSEESAVKKHQSPNKLTELRNKHGQLEEWWKERFGFGFECLTASETRYLINTATSEKIRACIEDANA